MSKKLWILIAVVVVAGAVWWSQQPVSDTPIISLNGNTTTSPSPSVTVKKTTIKTTSTVTGSTPANTAAYSSLVTQYSKTGHLLQFDASCHVTPGQIVIKTGTQIMLDNRSNLTQTVNVGSTVYTLPAYNYRVVTVTSSRLPSDIGVDCKSASGSTENGGTIKLQALISQ